MDSSIDPNNTSLTVAHSKLGLLSDDPRQIASMLWTAISRDQASDMKVKAQQGIDYYNGRHDILKHRIFYVDDKGILREDRFASNIRIPHQFLTEIVDQKAQYLFSNPIEVKVDDDTEFVERLEEYYDEDFQLMLQEMEEGASQKGFEYVYARTTEDDKLTFQVANSMGVFPVFDDDNEVRRVVRYYERWVTKTSNTRPVLITKAEVWDDEKVWLFIAQNRNMFVLDESLDINPRPHVIAALDDSNDTPDQLLRPDQQYVSRHYGRIPFYRLSNNREERTDLEPIKAIIDDYDMQNAFLSNNLQDFAEAIYMVSGFLGDDLSTLRQNIKAKKVVATGEGGSIDIKTVTIPVEGRKVKMEMDRENIYKFGMAFDSCQTGDGNITNVVIKSRYALLNMKANKAEIRLKAMLKWINELVVADINRRYNTNYDPAMVEFEINRELIVNEKDKADQEKVEADTRQVMIETILASAPKLDDETVLKQLAEVYELDWSEIQEMLEKQEFTAGMDGADDLVRQEQNVPAMVSGLSEVPGGIINTAENVAGKTLNGAQTNALISVVQQHTNGVLTTGQAVAIIARSIGVTQDEAREILEGTGTTTTTARPPAAPATTEPNRVSVRE